MCIKITNEGKSQDKKIKKNNDKNKEISFMEDLNISSAYKRLLKFITAFLIISHVISCIWIFLGKIDYPNWIFSVNLQDSDDVSLYVAALYFNWTTIFTIGYGDITPKNI